MKIKKHSWKTLEIYDNYKDREICSSFLNEYMIGSEIKEDLTKIYFDKKDIAEVERILNENNLVKKYKWKDIHEENWNKNCLDFFNRIEINDRVEIIPKWESANDKFISVIINPALAFGTGHHETTYMMIQAILDLNIKENNIVDVGTGSGILSILLRKIGNKNIFAFDNDPLVESNFYENLLLNKIDNIDFKIEDCLNVNYLNYDVILANVNREIILKLIKILKDCNGLIILSGILIEDSIMVEKELDKNNKSIISVYERNEWKCIVAK